MTLLDSAAAPPSSPPPAHGPDRRGSKRRIGWDAIALAAIAVTIVAFSLASVGKDVIYALVGPQRRWLPSPGQSSAT